MSIVFVSRNAYWNKGRTATLQESFDLQLAVSRGILQFRSGLWYTLVMMIEY
jgi:hypothetical protein